MNYKYIKSVALAATLIFSAGCEEWLAREFHEPIPLGPCHPISDDRGLIPLTSVACETSETIALFPGEYTTITELTYKTSDLYFDQIAPTNSFEAETTRSLVIPRRAEYKLDLILGRVTFQKYESLYPDLETIQTIECPVSSAQAAKLRSLSNRSVCQTSEYGGARMMCYEEHAWITAKIQNHDDLADFRSNWNNYSLCSDLSYNYKHFCDEGPDALLGEIVDELNTALQSNACPDLSRIE